MSNLREDWSLLDATQESLREHMAEVHRLQAELASMHTFFEAAGRERSELRERAERAEAERDALRADARRYLWHKARNPSGLLTTAWGASKAACEIGDDPDAATDVAMRDDSVPIWETLAEIGESAPAGTWDAAVAPPARQPLTDEEIDKATAQERDALLDHIYEYGTAAEGVLERARKLCRAVERKVRGK